MFAACGVVGFSCCAGPIEPRVHRTRFGYLLSGGREMATIIAHAGGAITALAAAVPRLVGAGPADPRQDLGSHWSLAVSLCVVNAVVVVYYLIRIWTARDAPAV